MHRQIIVTVLLAAGLAGCGDSEPPAGGPTPPETVTSQAPSSTGEPEPSPSDDSWSRATAVFTGSDSVKTTVKADTVRYCVSAGYGVELNGSQEVPFERMRSIEVLRSDARLPQPANATLRVTLTGGQILEGTIGASCDFFGSNDIGRFSLYPDSLQRIDFTRP
jgi:hypothetical protein